MKKRVFHRRRPRVWPKVAATTIVAAMTVGAVVLLREVLPAGGLALLAGSPPTLDTQAFRPAALTAPCSTRYPQHRIVAFEPDPGEQSPETVVERQTVALDDVWGLRENARLQRDDSGRPILSVRYQAAAPATPTSPPSGGAGFLARLAQPGLERACLRYSVRPSEGFAFTGSGKLPGLYGGDAPSGQDDVDGTSGFSARLMWRAGGAGEVYAYVANKGARQGARIGEASWRLRPSNWTTIEQEVVLNEPGKADGVLRLWVDGIQVIEQTDVVFRTVPSLHVDGLMFSTSLGDDADPTPSPRDQAMLFGPFTLYGSS